MFRETHGERSIRVRCYSFWAGVSRLFTRKITITRDADSPHESHTSCLLERAPRHAPWTRVRLRIPLVPPSKTRLCAVASRAPSGPCSHEAMYAPFVVASWSTKAPLFHCEPPSLALPSSLGPSFVSYLSLSFYRETARAHAISLSLQLSLVLVFLELSVSLPEISSLVRLCPPPLSRTLLKLYRWVHTITVLYAPTRHNGQTEFNGSRLTFYNATTIRHVTRKSSRSSYPRVATTPVRFVGNFQGHAAPLRRHLYENL